MWEACIMKYEQATEYMEKLQSGGIVLGLDSMRRLLRSMGDPQDSLKFVHIAGTNGKGSVLSFVSSILRSAGYRTGRYCSPSVFSDLEKWQGNGRPISKADFVRGLEAVRLAAETLEEQGHPYPTPFEVETALAFWYFREKGCEIVVLETGMGGLLDATNIVTSTVAAVITSVSRDHMGMLGDTLEEIARQKAGIIKNGCQVITGKQEPSVMQVIKTVCEEKGVALRTADRGAASKVRYGLRQQSFSYGAYEKLKISLAGICQIENAILAVETVEALREGGYRVTERALRGGLSEARWPGRFSIVSKKPYFIVDGAHNIDAAQKLKESVLFYFTNKKIIIIIGMLKDKEYEKIVEMMAPIAAQVITVTTPDHKRSLSAYELAGVVRTCHPQVTAADSVQEAVEMAYLLADRDDVILAFGSLSYLGELCKIAENRESIRRDTHGRSGED